MAEDSWEDFLSQLAINSNSVHKLQLTVTNTLLMPVFIWVVELSEQMLLEEPMQEDWKRCASTSEEYFATIKQAEAKIKKPENKAHQIIFYSTGKAIYLLCTIL